MLGIKCSYPLYTQPAPYFPHVKSRLSHCRNFAYGTSHAVTPAKRRLHLGFPKTAFPFTIGPSNQRALEIGADPIGVRRVVVVRIPVVVDIAVVGRGRDRTKPPVRTLQKLPYVLFSSFGFRLKNLFADRLTPLTIDMSFSISNEIGVYLFISHGNTSAMYCNSSFKLNSQPIWNTNQ